MAPDLALDEDFFYCRIEPEVIQKYGCASGSTGERGQCHDSRSALQAIRTQPPHLLFLDIQIDSLNGVGIARALDPDRLPLIVFVTAYDQYALEAFEVSAVDYLLKPFDDDRFRKTLERVRRRREAEGVAERQAALSSVLAQIERSVRAPTEGRPITSSTGLRK